MPSPLKGGPTRAIDHAVVLGGAGFIGSNLCEQLLRRGVRVTCVDDFSTGSPSNIAGFRALGDFRFVHHDICDGPIPLDDRDPVGAVFHLASPASPVKYLELQLETLQVASIGTFHALDLAARTGARFVYTSTSEVYGDPEVSPQPETYVGRLSSIAERAVYTEGKRFGETLVSTYRRTRGVDTGIVRLFNSYGPRMSPDDGRLVPTFVGQAAAGLPLTVAGNGAQSRSLCHVDDIVDGLLAMMTSDTPGPVNLGNDDERTVLDLALLIRELCGSSSPIEFVQRLADDPSRRCPDIRLAAEVLGWAPQVTVTDGLRRTVDWYRSMTAAVA
ncbi:NAD-dependent epimerase/dehydratase family protein [Nakamurella sp. YIM 132087]|uniref:NAD-dependent epimerase/dehydratase family protein n=1 Tax=Nakamurella alba TaxID=2665158 RepID=A0A7K1FHN7_9ACTN|nr:NAD-dependent epimerase/dehydratase family protein [Nakamurella alba]MTD12384.1 NAD-dependent epimerase/dehydratase family protein [Nakamurella alba]